MGNKSVSGIERTIALKRDAILVKATLQGDTQSFARLMSLYKNRVAALGMSFFKNPTDTEDFVQDVFIKVFLNLSSFRGDALFSTWLTRIAYNTAVNSVKRRKEYLSIIDEGSLYDPGFTPEEREIRNITAEAVRESLKDLPEKYGVCMDMYFFYDISYSEISEITGFPVNTIKSHIFRAKKILREKLRSYHE
jgi:RNA polymerase sigma-70 factor (ECF subfamily)